MYKHKLLIANSMITDPVFSGSVIFVFEHNKKLSQGVILNSTEIGKLAFGQMQDLFNSPPGSFNEAKEMIINGELKSVPIFSGGPCITPGIFFIHGYEELVDIHKEQGSEYDLGIPSSFNIFSDDSAYKDDIPNSSPKMEITEGLYFGSPFTFGHLIESGRLDENKFKFFTGLSVWTGGQLEFEIQSGAWTVVDPTPDLFFDNEELNKLSKSVSTPKEFSWIPKTSPGFDPSFN